MTGIRRAIAVAIIAASSIGAVAGAEPSLLHAVFSDGAVLQRERPVAVWGRARPGETVTLAIASNTVAATADADGRWRAMLPALEAGGPYALTARTGRGRSQTAHNVLVGDVFLCSGQSNIVLQVHRTNDSRSEIAGADNDRIRMLTIGEGASAGPLEDFAAPVKWLPATRDYVRDFSGTCYYFARELQKSVDVPMGLIVAASGGTRIETWMSADGVAAIGGREERIEIAALHASDAPAAARRWGAVWEGWWRAHAAEGDAPWSQSASPDGWKAAPGVGAWDAWGDAELVGHAGMAFLRTSVVLTQAQAAKGATLFLGGVDEIDQTWVNGVSVGGGSGGNRAYRLAPDVLRAGENIVVVNVLNTYKRGGLIGPASAQKIGFDDGGAVALAGPWRYRRVPLDVGAPPRAPWESLAGVAMAFNAMIAPVAPYGLKGVVWYQGEGNTDEYRDYRAALTALMADWRRAFSAHLPFFIVQLHGYGPPPTAAAESGWAQVREAQRAAAAADPDAALIVTTDIGDPYDIHPANKQELGRRLALAARGLLYGETVAASGPVAARAWRQKKSVVISFEGAPTLVAHGGPAPVGFELCGEAAGTCRFVNAEIVGSSVRLDARGGPADRVRFCWMDSPVCTLFDSAGLPAGPFDVAVGGAP